MVQFWNYECSFFPWILSKEVGIHAVGSKMDVRGGEEKILEPHDNEGRV